MDRCQICNQPETRQLRSSSAAKKGSTQTIITCSSGASCNGTAVHAGCANLTGPVLEALIGAQLGLFWACEQCRKTTTEGSRTRELTELGTIRQLAQRMVATMDANLTPRGRKGKNGWKGAALPAEMWERIFGMLTGGQLLGIRLTCRRWRDVVDGSSRLRDRLVVRFPKGLLVNGRYRPVDLMPFAKKVIFEEASLFKGPCWWPRLGHELTELTLKHCKCLFTTLLAMLRETPCLKVLTWDNVMMDAFDGRRDLGFRLDKLEALIFASNFDIEVLAVLRKLCPNLKKLALSYEGKFQDFTPYVYLIEFVEAVQCSLEELKLGCTEGVLNKVMNFERLKLTKLSLHGEAMKDTSIAVAFCRKMPTLKDLQFEFGFEMRESDLEQIAKALPNLERFATRFPEQKRVRPSFLAHMPNLRHLALVGNEEYCEVQTINFTGTSCPVLTHLKLEDLDLPQDSLQQLLANSPNVTNLTLKAIQFTSWRALILALAKLHKLQQLLLTHVRAPKSEESTWPATSLAQQLHSFVSLCRLEVDRVKLGEPALLTLLGMCPAQLKELALRNVEDVGENALRLLLGCKFGQLDELTMLDCGLWPEEERDMCERFRAVKLLRISDYATF